MFPERQTRSFLDTRRPVAAGGFAAAVAPADAGKRFGPASQPASRVERRVRRISQVCSRRRSAPARLARLRPHAIGSTSKNSRPTRICAAAWCSIPAARWISLARRHENRIRPPDSPGPLAGWRRSKATPSGYHASPMAWSASIPPRRNPAHLSVVFDLLEQARPKGETQLVPILHELGETIRQRALIVIMSDFFVEPDELRSCFEHLRFRKHDIAAFHLLDPLELEFTFRRPMRFFDMEGGAGGLCRAERNCRALPYGAAKYLASVEEIRASNRRSTITACASTKITSKSHAVPRRPHARRSVR